MIYRLPVLLGIEPPEVKLSSLKKAAFLGGQVGKGTNDDSGM
jgi:hypothetical protein